MSQISRCMPLEHAPGVAIGGESATNGIDRGGMGRYRSPPSLGNLPFPAEYLFCRLNPTPAIMAPIFKD